MDSSEPYPGEVDRCNLALAIDPSQAVHTSPAVAYHTRLSAVGIVAEGIAGTADRVLEVTDDTALLCRSLHAAPAQEDISVVADTPNGPSDMAPVHPAVAVVQAVSTALQSAPSTSVLSAQPSQARAASPDFAQ